MNVSFGPDVQISVTRDVIDITCGIPTQSETWRYTDANGHEHYWDNGYPTLGYVIDAEHWCNGNEGYERHDPHMHVDEAHWVCKLCGLTIEPGEDPAFTPKQMAGAVSATIKGRRDDGTEVTGVLSPAEIARLQADPTGATALAILNELPADRIVSVSFSR